VTRDEAVCQGNHDITKEPDWTLKFSNGRSLDFTAGTTKEEELEALEKEMREELGIPDDTDVLAHV
jgi:8-oxo-dGTP pyrophosphatase MutT (NUDIX family)